MSQKTTAKNIRFSQIVTTLVGFSLGAHVMGMAGHYLRGKLHRITGMLKVRLRWGVSSVPLQVGFQLEVSNAVKLEWHHK